MADKLYLKKGDTYPNIETTLSDTGGPVDLTDCTVVFRMSEAGSGNILVEKPAVVRDQSIEGNLGKCYAEFEEGDTDIVGTYRVEWRVTFYGNKVATFPRSESSTDFNYVVIQPNVS